MQELSFQNINGNGKRISKSFLKAEEFVVEGNTKITFEEDDMDGIRIMLEKDDSDGVRGIKFMCSCGHTKSVILDYSE